MSIEYAAERLHQTGWQPDDNEIEFTRDGTPLPSVNAVRRAFARTGHALHLKQNLMFGCYTATWTEQQTAIGVTELEAAVMALAQLRESQRFPKLTIEPKSAKGSHASTVSL
jgi:hypothetical protein